MRQLPLTMTDQIPFRSPVKGCKRNPGNAISRGSAATLRRPRINRSFAACFAWIPAVLPRVKKRSNPLCRKFRMATLRIVTRNVSGYNQRLRWQNSSKLWFWIGVGLYGCPDCLKFWTTPWKAELHRPILRSMWRTIVIDRCRMQSSLIPGSENWPSFISQRM